MELELWVIWLPYFRCTIQTLGLHYPTDVECSVGSVFEQAWSQNFVPKGCPASSIVTLNFDKTSKNDSKIEMVWMDGGLRPSHPDAIPADDFLVVQMVFL